MSEPSYTERLRRSEMTALKMLYTLLAITAEAKDDLWDRLQHVPHGRWMLASAFGMLGRVCKDVRDTATKEQKKQMNDTLLNYKVQVVPKATPLSDNVVITKQQAYSLVNIAKDRCRECTENGFSCRKCELYKFLEAADPLEDYGNDLMCPYALREWK